ncbi:unnamed protein product, partial [Symbiodinium sp. CCMP2456]
VILGLVSTEDKLADLFDAMSIEFVTEVERLLQLPLDPNADRFLNFSITIITRSCGCCWKPVLTQTADTFRHFAVPRGKMIWRQCSACCRQEPISNFAVESGRLCATQPWQHIQIQTRCVFFLSPGRTSKQPLAGELRSFLL